MHTINLRATRVIPRVLAYWKGEPLIEIMVRVRDYQKRISFNTQRIKQGIKKVPVVLTRFGLKEDKPPKPIKIPTGGRKPKRIP